MRYRYEHYLSRPELLEDLSGLPGADPEEDETDFDENWYAEACELPFD